MKIENHTPREFAYATVLHWIHAVYKGRTGDLDNLTEAQRREILRHVAKIYNGLLDKSNLDGLHIGE